MPVQRLQLFSHFFVITLIAFAALLPQIVVCHTVKSLIVLHRANLTVDEFDGVRIVLFVVNLVKKAQVFREAHAPPISDFELKSIVCVHSSRSSVNQLLQMLLIHVLVGPNGRSLLT